MTDTAVAGGRVAWRGRLGTETLPAGTSRPAGIARAAGKARDARRTLQLALAGVWLIDGVLQFQPSMFSRAFGRMLAAGAAGNPAVVARPITWNASLVEHHAAALNAVFAAMQVLLGLGIAFRPTVRPALAASIAWAVGVWWFGEGLGGVLTGTASPVTGAPGAAIIYALLAALLWPAGGRGAAAPFPAAQAVGARVARTLWLLLWLSFAWFALQPANRAPQALHETIAAMANGEPGWLAAVDRNAAALLANHGLAASIVLAAAFTLAAAGVFLPRPAARATLVLAMIVAAVIWVTGQAFGMILAGGATDPNSGLLLILLALAYWPARAVTPAFPSSAPAELLGTAAR